MSITDVPPGGLPRPAAQAEARTIALLEILAEQGAETNRLLETLIKKVESGDKEIIDTIAVFSGQ